MNALPALLSASVLGLSLSIAAPVLAQEPDSENTTAPVEDAGKKISAPVTSEQVGLAAYYHVDFHGRRTANGETFDHNALAAAHKTLPFGTLVRVINLRNNKSVVVRVNDRGPMQPDRVIDLTRRAATALGFIHQGMTRVALEILPPGSANKTAPANPRRARP